MDRYRKKEKNGQIGVGAYGVVYRAQDLMTGVDVAMKKIPLNQSDEGVPGLSLFSVVLLYLLILCNCSNCPSRNDSVEVTAASKCCIFVKYCHGARKSSIPCV